MAQTGKTVKRFMLTVLLLALLVIAFILLGGGKLLKSTGSWMSGIGKEAEVVKQKMEQKASKTSQAVEKVIDTVNPEEKSGEKK